MQNSIVASFPRPSIKKVYSVKQQRSSHALQKRFLSHTRAAHSTKHVKSISGIMPFEKQQAYLKNQACWELIPSAVTDGVCPSRMENYHSPNEMKSYFLSKLSDTKELSYSSAVWHWPHHSTSLGLSDVTRQCQNKQMTSESPPLLPAGYTQVGWKSIRAFWKNVAFRLIQIVPLFLECLE